MTTKELVFVIALISVIATSGSFYLYEKYKEHKIRTVYSDFVGKLQGEAFKLNKR